VDRRGISVLPAGLRAVPLPIRWSIVGSGSAGVTGAIVGLAAGLYVYPPTAWFAVFELGVPAAITGAVIGLIVGLIAMAGRRIKRAGRPVER
jgi:hypothetical protein